MEAFSIVGMKKPSFSAQITNDPRQGVVVAFRITTKGDRKIVEVPFSDAAEKPSFSRRSFQEPSENIIIGVGIKRDARMEECSWRVGREKASVWSGRRRDGTAQALLT